MRISDWSSDVCSSDLAPIATASAVVPIRRTMERDRGLFDLGPAEVVVTASAAVLAHVAEGGLDAGAIVGLEGGGQRDRLLLQHPGMLDEALPVPPDLGLSAKNGRDSCRERVCY